MNRYISRRVLRSAYRAHAAPESLPVGPGAQNELYKLREFFYVAKGQKKGTRMYNQRIRRMHDMYEAMERDASVSVATRAFAKDIVEHYMIDAYNAQRKHHAKKGVVPETVTLDQILDLGYGAAGAKEAFRPAEQTRSSSERFAGFGVGLGGSTSTQGLITQYATSHRTSSHGTSYSISHSTSDSSHLPTVSPMTRSLEEISEQNHAAARASQESPPYVAEDISPGVVTPLQARSERSVWQRIRAATAGLAAIVMLPLLLGAPGYSSEVKATPQTPVAVVETLQPAPQKTPQKSVRRQASLSKIVFSIDDHDSATPDSVYTMQGGRLRSADGEAVSVIRMREGDELVTDLSRSVFHPKPGETIDIGYRYFGADGVRSKDDVRFRRALPITRTVNLESLGFVASETGAGRGALFYMAEPGPKKISESVAIPVELLPRVPSPAPAPTPPPPEPAPLEPTPPAPVPVASVPPAAAIPPAPCLPVLLPAQPPAGKDALTYVRAMAGTSIIDVVQERVAMAPVDPHYELKGNSFRLVGARLTKNSAFNTLFERSATTGSSRIDDNTLHWSKTSTLASVDLKHDLTAGTGTRPFLLAGLEAQNTDSYMTNRLNFEPGRTTEWGPKVGIGIVRGAWNDTNAYIAVTGSMTSEHNHFYENGWAWGNPHIADFGMSWESIGAEAGVQKMFSKGMVDVTASFRQDVTEPEPGFHDQRFKLDVIGVYDFAHFRDVTVGLVGRAGLATLEKRYADPIWNYTHTVLPTVQGGIQLQMGGNAASGATATRTEKPVWQGTIDATVGLSSAEFDNERAPSDVGDGSLRGTDYGLGVKLRTPRLMVAAAESYTTMTQRPDLQTIALDQIATDVGLKWNVTSQPLTPFLLGGYSLENSHFDVDFPGSFRKLQTTRQGWEGGVGLVHGPWTGNNVYTSFSIKSLEETGDSRNSLKDWGKPDVVMDERAWNEWIIAVGTRQFLGNLQLEAEGFYHEPFSATGDSSSTGGFGATGALSFPVLTRPNWSLGLLGSATWQTRTDPFSNQWLNLPNESSSVKLGVRFDFGKRSTTRK